MIKRLNLQCSCLQWVGRSSSKNSKVFIDSGCNIVVCSWSHNGGCCSCDKEWLSILVFEWFCCETNCEGPNPFALFVHCNRHRSTRFIWFVFDFFFFFFCFLKFLWLSYWKWIWNGVGVAVGAGWQALVAYVNIGSYYVFGLPLGLLMGFVLNWGVLVSPFWFYTSIFNSYTHIRMPRFLFLKISERVGFLRSSFSLCMVSQLHSCSGEIATVSLVLI